EVRLPDMRHISATSRAAARAAARNARRALTPPMTATTIRTELDVEVANALGVRLDELLARLYVGTHQLLERVVDRCHVVHRDFQQHAARWVHGRRPELVGVHLTETLHACDLSTLAKLAHRLVTLGLGLALEPLRVLAGAFAHLEQWRLRDVEVALFADLREVAEEKREQQRTDVTAVDVCIGHRHDAVVADLFDV